MIRGRKGRALALKLLCGHRAVESNPALRTATSTVLPLERPLPLDTTNGAGGPKWQWPLGEPSSVPEGQNGGVH